MNKIELIESPIIYVDYEALCNMETLIDAVPHEIGWMGLSTKIADNTFLIYETILLEQRADHTTCEINPGAISLWGLENPDKVNDLRVWGHSHATMGVTPSHQDDIQLEELYEAVDDYFIRVIMNKKGDINLTLIDVSNNYIIKDMTWRLYAQPNPALRAEVEEKVKDIPRTDRYWKKNETPSIWRSW